MTDNKQTRVLSTPDAPFSDDDARFRMVFEAAPVGMAMIDPERRFLHCNEAFCDFLGYSDDELKQKTIADVTYPDDLSIGTDELNRLIQGVDRSAHYKKRYVRKDGKVVWGDVAISLIRDVSGAPLYFLPVIQDITARVESDLRLRSFMALVDAAPMMICLHDLSGAMVYANRKTFDVHQYTKDEFLAINPCDIVVPGSVSLMEQIDTIVRAGEATLVVSHYRKDGSVVPLEIFGTVIDWMEKPAVLSIGNDISERKQAEENLLSNREFLKVLLETIPAPVFYKDKNFKYLGVNRAFEDFYGTTAKDMIGKTAFDIAPREFAEKYHEKDMEIFETQERQTYEAKVKDLRGNLHDVIFEKAAICSSDGETIGIVGIIQDITERNRYEAALKESEQKFSAAFRTSPYVITITRAKDGKLIDVNDAFEPVTGYTREEALNSSSVTLGLWDNEEDRNCVLRDLAAGKTVVGREYKYRRKDGGMIYALFSAHVLMVGTDACVLSSLNIITERKKMEEALRESEEKHRALYNNAPLAYQSLDENGHFLDVNPAWLEILGYERDEVIGHWFGDFLHLEWRPHFVRNFTEFKRRGYVSDVQFRMIHKSGEYRDVSFEGRVGRSDDGNFKQTYCVFQDITEHKRAELALRESEERYRRLFSSMLEGFAVHEILLDSHGKPYDYRFLAINPAFMRLTGLGQDVIGKTLREALPQTDKRWIDVYGKVALTGEPIEFEDYSEDLNRHWYVTAFRNAPMQFACIFQDITERKRIAEERERLQDQLQQAMKMEAVGRLAGGIAHDFNNLLTGIVGNVGMAMIGLPDDDPMFETLNEVNKAADTAAALTRQLLAFSRKQLIEPRVVDLNEIISDLKKMLIRLIGEDIELETSKGDRLWPVKVDPGQFEQILVNLAVNARDAMPEGGKLMIETANVYLDEEYCNRHAPAIAGYYVMLAVSDTGFGMSDEIKKHIFEPFFTTKEKGRGTGLGLATIYGAVKQSGGLVDVYSEVGHGTTFRIYIPRVEEELEVSRKPLPISTMKGGSETILLVEDEPIVRSLSLKILKMLGYHVIHAANGAQALEVAQSYEEHIDLLLTDVVMPGMNGRQLAERLTAMRPDLKVVFTSGYTENAIAHHGVIDEGLAFIAKPYTPQGLAAKVRETLDA